MNPAKVEKKIDYNKLNIGTELECYIVHTDSLREITKEESQSIFKALGTEFGWELASELHGEIPRVSKKIEGLVTDIKIDCSYAILEISTREPASSLEQLEKIHIKSFSELRMVLRGFDLMIWPFGVAPASSGLFSLPFKTSEKYTPIYYGPLSRIELCARYTHITSHQVNIDVALNKIIPTINALYRKLGSIIGQFANSPAYLNGRLYREGRYYFYNDYSPLLRDSKRFGYGTSNFFPPHPFADLQDYYAWTWQGEYCFVIRNGEVHTFKDMSMSIERFLKELKGTVVTPEGKDIEVTLGRDDVELFFKMHWMDFKPHFDFDEEYTLDDFLNYWNKKNLDGFFKEYCVHAYLEIRPCSPHFENNAMDIPRYFYSIFSDIDGYIRKAEGIDWEGARQARDQSLLA